MANPETQALDARWIDQIVGEVLARIGEAAAAAPLAAAPATQGAIKQAAVAPASAAAAGALMVTDRVVTVSGLAGRLDAVRSVVLERGAVLTPAARDLLRQHNVAIGYRATHSAEVRHALAVGVVETRYDCSRLIEAVRPATSQIERLAQTGLLSVIDELCAQVAKGGRLALVLTGQPDAAVCLANRVRGVRAVATADPAAVARAVVAVGANLLAVDPAGQGFFQLLRAVRQFVAGGARTCPAALAQRLG